MFYQKSLTSALPPTFANKTTEISQKSRAQKDSAINALPTPIYFAQESLVSQQEA